MSELVTAERNRLTQKQRFNLIRWMEGQLPRFTADHVTSAMAAKEATVALKFEVTPENVRSLVGGSKTAVLEHRWPSQMAGMHSSPKIDLKLVVRVLDYLMSNESKVEPPSLLNEWKAMVENVFAPEPAAEQESSDPGCDPETSAS